jgi:hypothetical protein
VAERLNTGAASYNKGSQLEIVIGQPNALDLRNRLLQGEKVKDLVTLVMDTWGFFADKKASTVSTMIYRYSREIVAKDTAKRVLDTVKSGRHVAVTTLEELTELCQKQKNRLEAALKTEAQMGGLLNDMTTKQVQLLGGLLKDLAVLQLETGLLPRAPKTVKGLMMGPDGQPTAFGWVESDEALLDALKSTVKPVIEHDPDDPV